MSMSGTSISDLMEPPQNSQDNDYSHVARMQQQEAMRQAFIRQQQNELNQRKTQYVPPQAIQNLVQDINTEIDGNAQKPKPVIKRPKKQTQETDDTEEEVIKDSRKKSSKWHTKVPVFMKDMVLFIVIYTIMSTKLLTGTVSSLLKVTAPGSDGNVSMLGIMVYGMVLYGIYYVIRRVSLDY